jgi:hypothetical protein
MRVPLAKPGQRRSKPLVDFGLETIRQSVAALGRSKIGYAGRRKVCSWHLPALLAVHEQFRCWRWTGGAAVVPSLLIL